MGDDVTCYENSYALAATPEEAEAAERILALDDYVARNDTPECSESWDKHMVTIDAPAVHARLMAEERRYRSEWLVNLPWFRLRQQLEANGLCAGHAERSVDTIRAWLLWESER